MLLELLFYALGLFAVLAGPTIAERTLLKRRPDLVRRLALRIGRPRRIDLPPEVERALRPAKAGAYRTAEVGDVDPIPLVDANAITLLEHEVDGVVHVFTELKLVAVIPRSVMRKNETSWVWFAELRVEDHALVLVPRFYAGGVITKIVSAAALGLVTRSIEVALVAAGMFTFLLAMQLALTAYRLQGIVAVTETLLASSVALRSPGPPASAPGNRFAEDAPETAEEGAPTSEPEKREGAAR